jgi:hypothetical protein
MLSGLHAASHASPLALIVVVSAASRAVLAAVQRSKREVKGCATATTAGSIGGKIWSGAEPHY